VLEDVEGQFALVRLLAREKSEAIEIALYFI